MRRPSRCTQCDDMLDPVLPDCRNCGEPVPVSAEAPAKKKHRWPIPWGLFIVLGLYSSGAYFFGQHELYTSPQYLAARHLRAADQLLGRSDGNTAKTHELLEAMEHLLGALRQLPEDSWSYSRAEAVARRLNERGEKIPPETKRALDALGLQFARAQVSKRSVGVIGARDIWDVDDALALPGRFFRYSTFGGLFIIGIWLYMRWQDLKSGHAFAQEKENAHRKELEELNAFRRRPKKR